MSRRPPRPTLFPYTTLFRSRSAAASSVRAARRETRAAPHAASRAPAAALPAADPAHRDPPARRAGPRRHGRERARQQRDRKSTRLNSKSRRDLVCRLLLEKKKDWLQSLRIPVSIQAHSAGGPEKPSGQTFCIYQAVSLSHYISSHAVASTSLLQSIYLSY